MSAFIFSIGIFNRCRWVRLARYTLAAPGVGFGYLHRPELSRACFLPDPFAGGAQALDVQERRSCGGARRTAASIFWGALTIKSRFEGFALSWERSNRHFGNAKVCRPPWCERSNWRKAIDAGRVCGWRWKFSHGPMEGFPEAACCLYYMVPSEFVSLRYFPNTPSGKVDVLALDAMRLNAGNSPFCARATPGRRSRSAAQGDLGETAYKSRRLASTKTSSISVVTPCSQRAC